MSSKALPAGGPDRFRFCLWYGDALDEGQTHEAALSGAHAMLQLLRWHQMCCIAERSLGPSVGGLPVELSGETWPEDEAQP